MSSNNSSPRGMQSSPIRVDFGSTAVSMMSVTSESDHQHHVLQQYSLNQLRTHEQRKTHSSVDISPRSQALRALRKSTMEAQEAEQKPSIENGGFTVPTPQVQLTEIWESDKSVPTVPSHHFKPHSCGMVELDKQKLRVEPSMTPIPAVLPPSPPLQRSPLHSNSDVLVNVVPARDKPVMYNAWTVARPISPTKYSTRLMHK